LNVNKVGGNRNYGYGKQLAWAGKQALLDRYGSGHYATRAAHAERWNRFAEYLKARGIYDARNIDRDTVERYGQLLKQQVDKGEMKTAYAQNLLSTINVVLEALRQDRAVRVSPGMLVGERSTVRKTIPVSDPQTLERSIERLNRSGQSHVAMAARLARDFGLRFREASLLNAQQSLQDAKKHNRINITEGTKGGRGKEVDRWVSVNERKLQTLKDAAELQQDRRNLIPEGMTYIQWRNHAYNQWRQVNRQTGIKGFHVLRAAYACERYEKITGYPAPVMAGERQAPKALDQQARAVLAHELGHSDSRIDVISAYIGSAQ
jgi:hypothetical protein